MATSNTVPEWKFDGTTHYRTRQFGAWEVSQLADLTDDGVEVTGPLFYGPPAEGFAEGTIFTSLDAARDAARQLQLAVKWAEQHLVDGDLS